MGNGVVILRAASAWTMSALTPSWPNETRDNVQLLLLDAGRDLLTRSRRRRNEKLNLTGRPDAIRYRQGSRRTRPAFTSLPRDDPSRVEIRMRTQSANVAANCSRPAVWPMMSLPATMGSLGISVQRACDP